MKHRDTITEEITRLHTELEDRLLKMGEDAAHEKEEYVKSRLIEIFGSLEEGLKKIHLVVLEDFPTQYEEVLGENDTIVYRMTQNYRLRMKTYEELVEEGYF